MTSVIKTTTIALALLGWTTSLALAQAATPEFAAVDTNADTALSWEELLAAWPTATEEQFKAADIDGSGGLSAEEYAALATK